MEEIPKIIVHPPECPLTPPTTPDRLPVDHTMLSTPRLGSKKKHKERQVAKMSNAAPDTPQSMPRETGKGDQQTGETPHQSPSPAEAAIQARALTRQKAIRESPTYIAGQERRRVIRERDYAIQMERLANQTRGWLDDEDPLYLPRTRQQETQGMTYRIPRFGGLRARASDDYDGLRLRDALKTDYVAPPNFGHRPGEAWLARREWEGFLRRKVEKWGGPEEVGGVDDEEGGGEGWRWR